MKCHVGVDAGTGLVHTMTVTAANDHDITQAASLIREDDEVVYGDSGYLGVEKRDEVNNDPHLSGIDYRINRRPKSLPRVSDNAIVGKDLSNTGSPPCAARWNTFFGSSSACLVTEKSCTGACEKTRTVCTQCLPAPICICLPEAGRKLAFLTRGYCALFCPKRTQWRRYMEQNAMKIGICYKFSPAIPSLKF